MKRHKQIFVARFIVFMILFLSIILLSNWFYINNIEKNKLIFQKEAEWQEYKNTIPNHMLDYAILGDSHARNSLNPMFINNSYNFGLGYEDYTETYYKINKIINDDGIKVNTFILELDTHSFSDKMRTNDSLFKQLSYYTNFIPIREISKITGKNKLGLFIQSKIKIIGKGKEILFYITLPHEPTPILLGWTNFSEDFSNEDRKTGAANKYKEHFSLKPNLIENRSFTYFIKILDFAKNNNISVVIIKYPLSYEYDVELKNHNISRGELYDSLFVQINKTNSEYLLLDYYDLFFEHPEYFVNSDHLNNIGAEILSKKVQEEISEWE